MVNQEEKNENASQTAEAAAGAAVEDQGYSDRDLADDPAGSEADQLRAEIADLKDQILRRRADFDNFRRRVERERIERLEFASMEAVERLLPVLDSFLLAKSAPCSDENYGKGVEMIYQTLFETLKNLGLQPFDSVGSEFDPNIHHAIEQVPTPGLKKDTVIEELQKGFLFKGRLLRPALVKVGVRQ